MTYHPKSILLCCLFLACKSDHYYLSLSRFIKNIDPDGDAGITEDDVKAPEFLLLQGLRFTLEVRHTFLPLRGGVADLVRIGKEGRLGERGKEKGWEGEVGRLADKVKGMLKREALLTDVYFLFTPSQIWLGALMACDDGVAEVYLQGKVEEIAERMGGEVDEVLRAVGRCRDILVAYVPLKTG
jgi:cyclin H